MNALINKGSSILFCQSWWKGWTGVEFVGFDLGFFPLFWRECEEHDCIVPRSTSTAKKNRARLNYTTDLRAKQTLLWHSPFRFMHLRWEKKYISTGNFVMFERWTGWLLCYTWDFALRLSLHRHLISTCTPEELKSYPIWKNRDIVGGFLRVFFMVCFCL